MSYLSLNKDIDPAPTYPPHTSMKVFTMRFIYPPYTHYELLFKITLRCMYKEDEPSLQNKYTS